MGLTKEQEKLAVELIGNDKKRLNVSCYFEHFEQIASRYQMCWREIPLRYSQKKTSLPILESKDLDRAEKILHLQLLIHGEENELAVAGVLCFEDIVFRAQEQGVGLEAIILANPWGAELGQRYNPDYQPDVNHGNDDLVRFQLADERWVDQAIGEKFIDWRLAEESDNLPVETVAMLGVMRQWEQNHWLDKANGGPRLRAVLGFHVDHYALGGGYGYVYGDGAERLRPVATEAFSHLTLRKPRRLMSGAASGGDGGRKVYVNKFGLVRDEHDGALASAAHLLGIPISAAVEFSGFESIDKITQAFGAFVLGTIDLVASQ